MTERRPTKSELRLARLVAAEPDDEPRGIFELFREEEEQSDEDAPLAREADDDTPA